MMFGVLRWRLGLLRWRFVNAKWFLKLELIWKLVSTRFAMTFCLIVIANPNVIANWVELWPLNTILEFDAANLLVEGIKGKVKRALYAKYYLQPPIKSIRWGCFEIFYCPTNLIWVVPWYQVMQIRFWEPNVLHKRWVNNANAVWIVQPFVMPIYVESNI